jgi:serine/threonine protein kinase
VCVRSSPPLAGRCLRYPLQVQSSDHDPLNAADKTVPMARPSPDRDDTLPVGTRLHEFEVLRVLGAGGFGIVYLATDHSLQRQVAIKEYMPSAFVARGDNGIVSLRSASHAETFELGLRSFINEARLLAQFDHPSLVKVYRFWEAHGTAYMAMQYYPGRTLKDERAAMSRAPDEAWLRRVIDPLLGALEVLHAADVYHRDISPDNILLLPDGRPVLLDFGAARRVIGDRTQTLTAILKPNYAPVEQYPDTGMRQGPWTDLYALAAVIRFMLTGQSPPASAARAVHDEMQALARPGSSRASKVSASLLSAIDWALAVGPQDRPHSVQVFRDAVNGDFMPPRSSEWGNFEDPAPALVQRPGSQRGAMPTAVEQPRRAARESRNTRWVSRAVAAIATAALGMLALGIWAQNARVTHAASVPADETSQRPPRVAPLTPVSVRPEAQIDAGDAASQRPSAMNGGPRQACTDRGVSAMPLCMNRECRKPHFREHPQCLSLREAMVRLQTQKDR